MTLALLNPIDNPLAWDFVTIAGVDSPGSCVIDQADRKHKYDVKQGKGVKGATTTFVSLPPAEITITFYLWTADHFAAWDSFLPLLRYDPTKQKKSQAFDVYHPVLAANLVKSVVTTSIGSIKHEGKQLYSIKVEFLEYFPPSKQSAVSTPNGSKAGAPQWVPADKAPGASADPAIAAAQAQVDQLSKEAQAASQ